jgi:hypothetical protein
MKLLVITLIIAVAAAALLGIVGQVYGYHSTAGIWLTLPNLPGIVAAGGLARLIGVDSAWQNGFVGLSVVALADWLAYFGLARIALALKRQISNSSS